MGHFSTPHSAETPIVFYKRRQRRQRPAVRRSPLTALTSILLPLLGAGLARAQEAPPAASEPAAPAAAPAPEAPAPGPAETPPPPPAFDPRLDALVAGQHELELRIETLSAATRPIPPPADGPMAGVSAKSFFLRSQNDWYVLMFKGRINVDWYNFLNRPADPPAGIVSNSAADPRQALKDVLFVRRARVGLAGTLARHIDFRVEGEFATVPAVGQYATLTDGSVVVNYTPLVELEVGQFYTPFTLENPTSENYADFMEKGAPIRFVVPTSREDGAMVFGELPNKAVRYWVGLFDGDGQNFKNLDNEAAVIGRAIVAPLAFWPAHPAWTEYAWIGGSGWWQRSENVGGPTAPSTTGATFGDIAAVTTQGGYGLFSSNYTNGADALGNAIRSHLAPNGTTTKYAFELNLPVRDRIGFRAEYVHQSIDLSEYEDVNPGNGNVKRTVGESGNLSGYGAYGEVYGWIGGPVNVERPGLYQPPHWRGYEPPPPPRWAVMLAAKVEHVAFDVSGFSEATALPNPAVGHYSLDVLELGGSLWYTRNARVMANYLVNYIGAGDAATAAPAEKKNIFFKKAEHELLFRLQVSL
jgi:hypothetical protein